MAAQAETRQLIESYYGADELETASPGRRLGGSLLDGFIVVFTLYIGWIVWFIIVASRGQTPGKQLLGMYIMREDGSRAGGGYTWLREWVVKGLLFGLISAITLYIAWVVSAAWCLWDSERQCLWDKVTTTYVAHSPRGFHPLTANEMRQRGQMAPGLAPASTRAPELPASTAEPAPSAGGDAAERLRELKSLLDEGVITEEQFEERRAGLVEEL